MEMGERERERERERETISLFIGDITTLSVPTNITRSVEPSAVKLYLFVFH